MKQYQITLKGHQFSVSSEYGEDHIRQVEHFLNERMERIASSCNCFNITTLAFLVSLNMADELLGIQENPEIQQEVVKKRLNRMNQELENLLMSAPEGIRLEDQKSVHQPNAIFEAEGVC